MHVCAERDSEADQEIRYHMSLNGIEPKGSALIIYRELESSDQSSHLGNMCY